MSKFFGDMLNEENMKKAKNSLYPVRGMYYRLEKEVDDATVGLNDLINTVKKAKESSIDNPHEREYIEKIKKEFDKIAYLIEHFAIEFKDNYEELSPIYIAEKLSGTFDQDDSRIMGIDESSPIRAYDNNGWKKKH